MKISTSANAKINIMLAITGVRTDGYHSLVSLVSPISLHDELALEYGEGRGGADSLECNFPGVPTDATNLVLKAAAAFRAAHPALPPAHFVLAKHVPHGAGLGGGSSDGVAALRLLNDAAGKPLSIEALTAIAAQLGSDCPLFLHDRPVIIRGRGERIEPVTDMEHDALRGRRLLLFKPDFPVSTADAYRAMRDAKGAAYITESEAEARLAAWRSKKSGTAPLPLFNNMETVVFAKHLALPALFATLREKYAVEPRMSGSGSACFVFLPDEMPADPVEETIREAWGANAFVRRVELE